MKYGRPKKLRRKSIGEISDPVGFARQAQYKRDREREKRERQAPNSWGVVMSKWQRSVLVVGLLASIGLAMFVPVKGHMLAVGTAHAHVVYRSWFYTLQGSKVIVMWDRVVLEQVIVWVPTLVIVLLLQRKRGRG